MDAPGVDGREEQIRELSASCADCWADFAVLVKQHRVSTLVVAALQSAKVNVPQDLAELAYTDQLKTMQGMRESKRLLDLLAAHSVHAVILKGPILGAALRGNPVVRQARDIDVLVDWTQFETALDLLEGAGYTLLNVRPPFGASRIAVWRRGQKDINLYNEELDILVELHHRPFAANGLMPKLGVKDAADEVNIGGAGYRIFSPPDLFAYLATHGTTSFWHRLKWLADIRAMIAGSSDEQMDQFLDRCQYHGVERCGALAILLCHHLWPGPMPPRVAALLKDDRSLQAIEEQSLRTLTADASQYAPDRDLRRIGATFKLRSDWKYRFSILRVLAYDEQQVAKIPLPASLAFLYLPLRLLQVLGNYRRRAFSR